MLVKTEAEAEAQKEWDAAMAWARETFESSWKCHLREKEASPSGDQVLNLNPSTMLAMCFWLEELGPHLVASRGSTGDIEWYQDVTPEGASYLSQKHVASKVENALQGAQDELKEMMKVVDFNTFEVDEEHGEIRDDFNFKLKLWKVIGETNTARALHQLEQWKAAWQLDYWPKYYPTRKGILCQLRDASKVIRIAAHGICYSPEFAAQRIERMAKSYFIQHWKAEPAYPRKRKERDTGTRKKQELAAFKQSGSWDAQALRAYGKRFRKGVRCYYYAIEGIQSSDQNEVDMSEVENMQEDIDVGLRALHKAASKLRFKLHDDWEQEHNQETVRLQEENKALKATVAADRKKVEEEKAQLEASRFKFNKERAQVKAAGRAEALACLKCRQRPHNVVVIPCLHAKYCLECLQTHRKTSTTCPICAGAISGTLQYKV